MQRLGRAFSSPSARRRYLWIGLFGLPLALAGAVAGLPWFADLVLLALVMLAGFGLIRLAGRSGRDLARSRTSLALTGLAALVIVSIVIQAVPYRAGGNPPVTAEPAWDSELTRELTVKACFDCHSNEVHYPWYSKVAPIAWAVKRHVDGGRGKLNFSEWDRPQREAHESAETVEDGSMPPWYYELRRPGLLSEVETRQLAQGLEATLGTREDRSESDSESDDDD